MKKGQVFAYKLMIVFMVTVTAILLLSPFISIASGVRTEMDCTNSTISDGTAMACLFVDLTPVWYIGAVFAAGIALLFAGRKLGVT